MTIIHNMMLRDENEGIKRKLWFKNKKLRGYSAFSVRGRRFVNFENALFAIVGQVLNESFELRQAFCINS